MLRIFDENRLPIGVATREQVHKLGLWHETFHCLFIGKEKFEDYLYFQLRSPVKKDYPNLLDITAAGHILAHETIDDGVREVKEEIGIDVSTKDLVSLGVIDYYVTKADFIDQELANVFLYEYDKSTFDDFTLQAEEVSGIFKVEFTSFEKLWLGMLAEVTIEGFELDTNGEKVRTNRIVNKSSFVPHEDSYYESILKSIKQYR